MDREGVPTRIVAAAFALSAFAIAVLSGLWASNPTAHILKLAIASSFVCYFVGLVVGTIGERSIAAHGRAYEAANPIPDIDAEIAAALEENIIEVDGVVEDELDNGEQPHRTGAAQEPALAA